MFSLVSDAGAFASDPAAAAPHFGAYLGKKIAGIRIVLPGDYLRNRVEGRR